MKWFGNKKNKNIEESSTQIDPRLENLYRVDCSYVSVGIEGEEGLSPSTLSASIRRAIRDMESLIEENAELRRKLSDMENALLSLDRSHT